MKARRKPWASETDFARDVIYVLKQDDWQVWQEVKPRGTDRRADIVAVRDPLVMIVETKLRFGLAVVEQAWLWRGWAHLVSVAVPHSSNGVSPLLRHIAEQSGIGAMFVGPGLSVPFRDNHLSVEPSICRRPVHLSALRERLTDEQRNYGAVAGGHDSWTPWKQTCMNLERVVANNPGIKLKAAIDATRHHYQGAASARASLKRWIEAERVGRVRIMEGKLWLDWQISETAKAAEGLR